MKPPCLLQTFKDLKRRQSENTGTISSVPKVWDVIVRVTPVTLGGVVGDSQMVEPGQEHQEPYDDDGNGAVRVLRTTRTCDQGTPGDISFEPTRRNETLTQIGARQAHRQALEWCFL